MRIEKNSSVKLLAQENTSLDSMLRKSSSQMRSLLGALSDPKCSSAAYQAISNRITNLRIPALQAQYSAFEALASANETNISAIRGLPESSAGVLDTDECYSKIEELADHNRLLQTHSSDYYGSGVFWRFDNPYPKLIDANNRIIKDWELKIQAAYDYDSASASFYSAVRDNSISLLNEATTSIESYMLTGSCGDMGWTIRAQVPYEEALINAEYRVLAKKSLGNKEVYVSSDYKYIFYNGRKFTIEGGPGDVKLGSDFLTYYTKPSTFNEFNWGYFLANFGSGMKNAAPKNFPVDCSEKNVRIGTGAASLLGTFGNAADSMEAQEFALQFKKNSNGEYKVAIVRKNENMRGQYSLVGTIGNIELGSRDAASVYERATGKQASFPVQKYDIVTTYDENRSAKGAYDEQYHFDEKGNLKVYPIRYPDDKIEVVILPKGRIDITEWTYAHEAGSANSDASSKIGTMVNK